MRFFEQFLSSSVRADVTLSSLSARILSTLTTYAQSVYILYLLSLTVTILLFSAHTT